MDNRTQVNVNRNNRIPPWAWGAIAAAILALLLALFFLLNRPSSETAATPTPSATTAVIEVTSTPNLLTPSATPLIVEVTPTPGSPTAIQPTATERIVQVTATPAPATATPEVGSTITAPPTVTEASTPSTESSPSPQVTMSAGEQEVMNLLTASPDVGNVSSVRYDGTNLQVDYQLAAGGSTEAREQVRAMLIAIADSNLNYSNVTLTGSQTPGQGTPAIELTYDRNTVTTTNWEDAPDADVFGLAQSRTLQPPYDTP